MTRRASGRFSIALDTDEREVLVALLRDLGRQVEADPHGAHLGRLRPPAYLEDPDQDAAYQLLAGEELRSSHQAAIESVIASIDQPDLSEEELWHWLQALNALRLVIGTLLEITDDDHGPEARTAATPEAEAMWQVYDFTTHLQYEAVRALAD